MKKELMGKHIMHIVMFTLAPGNNRKGVCHTRLVVALCSLWLPIIQIMEEICSLDIIFIVKLSDPYHSQIFTSF